MAQDIAVLGIEVRTSGVQQANRDLQNLTQQGGRAETAVQGLERRMSGLRAAFAGVGFAAIVGKMVSVQREFDVLNSSLVTVTGSSEAAAREFSWIKEFAATTPFQLNEVTQAFVKMKALGLDATQGALTSYGNTASAMGKSLNQMIEAVADAATGEFERLKEFGIRARQSGDVVSLTFQGVTKTIGNSADEITRYLNEIGNNQFAGAMAERAKTLDGQISNLADSWEELFRTINQNNAGTLIYDSIQLANGSIRDAITIIEAMNGATRDNARETGAMAAIQSGIATVFETVAVTGLNVKYVLTQIGNELGGLAAQAAAIAKLDFAAAGAIGSMMRSDAEAARNEVDAASARILSARKRSIEDLAKAAKDAASATSKAAASVSAAPRRAATRSRPTREDLNAGSDTAAAQEFSSAINAIASAQREAEKSGLSLNAAQSVLYDLMRSPEWERMPEAWRQVVIEQTAAATAADGLAVAQRKQAEAMEEGRAIVEQTRTPSEALGVTVARLNKLLEMGAIDWETYSRAIFGAQDSFDALSKKAEETSDVMSEFAKNFARSAQSTISDLLFDSANGKIDGIAQRFGQAIQRMAADATAAMLMEKLFGDSFGKTGKVDSGSWAGSAGSWISSAATFISTLFSANGNAFAGSGAVQKFAAGGAFGNGEVLTKPTAFRLASGGAFRNGIAGEAGPEGALPLKRMSNGKLGVYADGGKGGGSTVINVTVNGGSAPDVRRAAGQGAREALSAFSGAQRYQ